MFVPRLKPMQRYLRCFTAKSVLCYRYEYHIHNSLILNRATAIDSVTIFPPISLIYAADTVAQHVN